MLWSNSSSPYPSTFSSNTMDTKRKRWETDTVEEGNARPTKRCLVDILENLYVSNPSENESKGDMEIETMEVEKEIPTSSTSSTTQAIVPISKNQEWKTKELFLKEYFRSLQNRPYEDIVETNPYALVVYRPPPLVSSSTVTIEEIDETEEEEIKNDEMEIEEDSCTRIRNKKMNQISKENTSIPSCSSSFLGRMTHSKWFDADM